VQRSKSRYRSKIHCYALFELEVASLRSFRKCPYRRAQLQHSFLAPFRSECRELFHIALTNTLKLQITTFGSILCIVTSQISEDILMSLIYIYSSKVLYSLFDCRICNSYANRSTISETLIRRLNWVTALTRPQYQLSPL
jgi:hypothetical protein